MEHCKIIIEPFRIKSVEAVKFTHRAEREACARPGGTCSFSAPRTC